MEDQSLCFSLIDALWIAAPPALVLGLAALARRWFETPQGDDGDLIYTIHCAADGRLRIRRHGPFAAHEPALLFVAPALHDEFQAPYRLE